MEKLAALHPGTEQWNKVLESDFPKIEITEETKHVTRENSVRFRGSMRLSTGKFFTDQEYEEYHERILNTSLP